MKSVLNFIVVLALLAGGTYYFAPGLWAELNEIYRENAGWTEQAKKDRPIAYLEYVIKNAEREYGGIDEYALNYNHAITALGAQRDDSRIIVNHDNQLLDEMKALYKTVENGETDWPVQFRDAAYTEEQFKQQIQVLLNERETHEDIAKRLNQEVGQMHNRLSELKVAKADYKAKLAEMRANLAIARATKGTRAIDDIIKNADRVMIFVDKTSSAFSSPVRTASEINAAAKQSEGVSNSDVSSFLSQ